MSHSLGLDTFRFLGFMSAVLYQNQTIPTPVHHIFLLVHPRSQLSLMPGWTGALRHVSDASHVATTLMVPHPAGHLPMWTVGHAPCLALDVRYSTHPSYATVSNSYSVRGLSRIVSVD